MKTGPIFQAYHQVPSKTTRNRGRHEWRPWRPWRPSPSCKQVPTSTARHSQFLKIRNLFRYLRLVLPLGVGTNSTGNIGRQTTIVFLFISGPSCRCSTARAWSKLILNSNASLVTNNYCIPNSALFQSPAGYAQKGGDRTGGSKDYIVLRVLRVIQG